MSHKSGLTGLAVPVTVTDYYDWDKITGLLAAQEPLFPPGTTTGYQAITFGYLVGEVIRRITGQSCGQFFAAEIAGPLEADFHIGLPERATAPTPTWCSASRWSSGSASRCPA